MREIACDESGYEGEKLIGSTTRLFAHASICLPDDDAALAIAELRDRIRSPATQYKANHLLRAKHRPALEWFLGPTGPVHDRGHVFLLDKADFVRSRFALVFGFPPPDLALANSVLRSRGADAPGWAAPFREWLLADPIGRSVLDPLVPALVAAVEHWGPVSIAHDRQTQLPPRRLEVVRERCALQGIRFLDAESHPQIQIADILAGTVRRLSEDADPTLSHLLPPYLTT
ncbi:DUF3800 domain-containing protein [Micromonosporaceae bacterium Da 78-11]